MQNVPKVQRHELSIEFLKRLEYLYIQRKCFRIFSFDIFDHLILHLS